MPHQNKLILVDQQDAIVGYESKIKVHKEGLLHRAFSLLIFNSGGELLIQKRARNKYHSAGLWSNTCCSHPIPNEDIKVSAHRRLQEEMGFDCEFDLLFTFSYRVEFMNGLIENEYDHIFKGIYEGIININPEEVADYKWIKMNDLKEDIIMNPHNYTEWLKIILDKVE